MAGLVSAAVEPPVAVISLNRAERHNSLVPGLLTELVAHLEQVAARTDVSAILLRAEGASFSTGGDLQGFLDHWDAGIADYADGLVGALNRAILALRTSPLPVVAAVQGWLTGGSLGLVLGADLVLVDETTRVAPFYCEVGFAPDGGWSALLPDIIGESRAVAAQFTNTVWTGDELLDLGLAHRRVIHEELHSAAMEMARTVAGKAGTTLRATKAARVEAWDWQAPLDAERRRFVETIQQPGVREGVQAFVERTAGQRRAHRGSE